MKTYIIKNHLKQLLIEELLKENVSIFGIKIISLTEFISNAINYQTEDILTRMERYQTVELNELKYAIKEKAFINELENNRQKLAAYNVDLKDLKIHEEYAKLLNMTKALDFKILNNYLDKHDFSDYYIVDGNYSIFENTILKKMYEQGAKTFSFKSYDNQKYAVRVNLDSDAVDAICQYIINNKLDLNQVAIIANSDLFNFINIHAKRYNIPTNYTKAFYPSLKAKALIALVEYALNPTIDNYIKIVSSQIIQHENIDSFIEYFKNHVKEIKYASYTEMADLCDKESKNAANYKFYKDLELKANEIHNDYYPLLEKLNGLMNLKDVFSYAFSLISKNDKESTKIKNIIERYGDNLNKAYPLIKNQLLNLKLNKQYENAVLVSSYNDEIYNKEYLFVINPDINSYPGFKVMSGFISEDAIANSNYPSLKERYDNHLTHFDFLFKSKYSFFFLENTTLDGKAIEYNKFFNGLDKYEMPVVSNDKFFGFTKHKLDEKLAQNVFFRNNDLSGSISRFEKYFNCPYSYFLNYGIKLNEPNRTELSAAITGTMIHYVFEQLLRKFHKEYNLQDNATIRSYLNEFDEQLKTLYPNRHKEIDTIINRIMNSIELEMLFIDDMEKNTVFKPVHPEFEFNNVEFTSYKNHRLLLRGIIDRVDESGQCYRIIDYKTSAHALKQNDLVRGLQLQLLTYVYVYEMLSKKTAVAAYYLNIAHPKIDVEYYKFSKSKGIQRQLIDDDAIYDKFMSGHKMKGLAFSNFDGLDFNFKHINTRAKDRISDDYLIDIDKTQELLIEIYQNLLKNLDEGNIELTPHENACKYCKYHSICHFKGLKDLRNDPISDIDIKLERKEDAETE